MTSRTKYLSQIKELLSIAETELRNGGRMELLDDNRAWEDIICRVLNLCYSWKLTNLNGRKANYPGIDLGDDAQGLGLQVSVEKDSQKVRHSLQEVIENKVYESFPRFKFFVLGRKQNSYSLEEDLWKDTLVFDPAEDIMDFPTLLQECSHLETAVLKEIAEYLQEELGAPLQEPADQDAAYRKMQAYTEAQREENAYIPVLGLGKRLPMEKVWIQLRLIPEEELEEQRQVKKQWGFLNQYDEYSARRDSTYDVETLLGEEGCKVVLAGPGMGKSTLCKKLFFLAEREHRHAIKVRLWDVAGRMREGKVFDEALRLTMTKALSFHLEKQEIQGYFSVLLLDGLDECGDMRRRVAREIAEWGMGHSSVQIIVTSRPVGYDDTELRDYRHYQILPLEEERLEQTAGTLLEAAGAGSEENLEWFQSQMKLREVRELACRSPLLLGFLVQLSIRRKVFGQYKIQLYHDIMQEWLQGSSRDDEKPADDSELLRGAEAIAFYMMSHAAEMSRQVYRTANIVDYVSGVFERELECGRLKAQKLAGHCLEFWTQRGILDRRYEAQEEYYLFLHLNIGEYLAACFLAQESKEERIRWIRQNYRDYSLQETIRLLIACEKEGCVLEELLHIELESALPDGALFLAADGAAESMNPQIPQEMYDKLLEYVQGDNPFLTRKAAGAAAKLKGKAIDWRVELLERELQESNSESKQETNPDSARPWRRCAVYHIYFHIPTEKQDYHCIRRYVLDYAKLEQTVKSEGFFDDLEEAVHLLRAEPEDTELTDALKNLYYDHCSLHQMGVLEEYLNRVGEGQWAREYLASKWSEYPQPDFEAIQGKLQRSERLLIETLAAVYGTEEPSEPVEACTEYSKFTSVLELMEAPITEMRRLQYDLEQPWAQAIVRAVALASGVRDIRLREELYVMLHEPADSIISISGERRLNIACGAHWECTAGSVTVEEIIGSLHSVSSIMAEAAMRIADANRGLEGLWEQIVQMFQGENRYLVHRAAILMLGWGLENDTNVMLRRINVMQKTAIPQLYDMLAFCEDKADVQAWEQAVRKGFAYGQSAVRHLLEYLLGDIERHVEPEVVQHIMPEIKVQFQIWLKKEVRCTHCEDRPVLDASGFCPKCRIGGRLPQADFVRVLSKWEQFSWEELAELVEHPNRDTSKAAGQGLRQFLERHPEKLQECLESLKREAYSDKVLGIVLKLSSGQLQEHRALLQELADGKNTKLTLRFIRCLESQEWMTAEEKKSYLTDMLKHPEEQVRSEAMRCWLGEKRVTLWAED